MPSGNPAIRRSKWARSSVSFTGLRPASLRASRLAAKASRKVATKCELKLRRTLAGRGLKFKVNVSTLPGCPDLVFPKQRIAVFADGDFWHGRKLARRIESLLRAHNSDYWIKKISSNALRDRRVRRQLRALGWHVVRVWESEILAEADRAADRIVAAVRASTHGRSQRGHRTLQK